MTFELILKQASQEQDAMATQLDYIEWGEPLSQEQYSSRELYLQSVSHSSTSKRTRWVLVPKSDPDTLDILCSCETYKRPLRMCLRSEIGESQQTIKNGISYGIASVFVTPKHRHKGYCKLFMSLLLNHFKSQPGLIATHLYSDIGPDFYQKLGWKTFPSLIASLSVDTVLSWRIVGAPIFKTLAYPDVEPLLEQNNTQLVKGMNFGDVLLVPSVDSIQWLESRSYFYSQVFGIPSSFTVGVSIEDSFLLWFKDYREKTLFITRFYVHEPVTAKILLKVAASEAKLSKLDKVVVWDPPCDLFSKLELQEYIRKRESSLSCLTCFMDGKSLDVKEWIANEKYSWI